MNKQLASTFGRGKTSIQSAYPLSDEQIASVAPSVYAHDKHASRSDRYTCIPTIDVLQGLRKEGFEPFFACQSRVRVEDKRDFTKHMLRLRYRGAVASAEANEIILVNSHDGTSSYQMLAGCFRFVCCNGMVCGDTMNDIRVRHSGNIVDNVIEGAFKVLDDFTLVDEQKDGMKALTLSGGEQAAFARAALVVKYGERDDSEETLSTNLPVTERQVLQFHRFEDRRPDLWATFNVVQENLLKGGLRAAASNGRRNTTRAVTGIDQGVKLNRALWTLAEEMRRLKAA